MTSTGQEPTVAGSALRAVLRIELLHPHRHGRDPHRRQWLPVRGTVTAPYRSGRRRIMSISPTTAAARVAYMVAAVLLAFGAGACRNDDTTQPASSASTSTPVHSVGSPPKETTAVRYTNRRDVCSALDHTRLTRELGADAGNLGQPRFSDTSASAIANCNHQYGPAGMRSLISLEVMTSKVGSAQAFYEGMRGAQQKVTAVTDVPGLGQQAAVDTDPTTGPHLLAYDENLYLSIAIIPVNSAVTEQVNTQNLLVACARDVLTTLRQP